MSDITPTNFRDLARQNNFWDRVYNDNRYLEYTKAASTLTGYGASFIGIEDDGGFYTSTTVEGALQ